MRPDLQLPENVKPLTEQKNFCFDCHPGVPCFTDCCRQLVLALSPFDVFRLKQELNVSGQDFLASYTTIELLEGNPFPQVFLAMGPDEEQTCPFVSKQGCTVYQGRPGACRTYPLGRAAWLNQAGNPEAMHELINEPHCLGFAETTSQNVKTWTTGQELAAYHDANDRLMSILHHPRIKAGLQLATSQQNLYIETLYYLEDFQQKINNSIGINLSGISLLQYAIDWLRDEMFDIEETT